MEAFVEVTKASVVVKAFVEAFVEVPFVEAFMEATTASIASVEASMKLLFCFIFSMESAKLSTDAFTSFHAKCQ